MVAMAEALVDFHCHLDLFPDFEELVRECDAAGLYTLAVTTTPRAWRRNHNLASATRHVGAALGLHPQLVADHGDEIALFEALLPETRYVGEVGLDAGPAHFRSLERQREVFRRVLVACASAGDKVLSVHSVRAATLVLDMVEAHLPRGRSNVVLHWFSGSKAEARRAVDLGCWFSINAAMMRSDRMSAIVRTVVPIDRILTETDGPFAREGDDAARPADVGRATSMLASSFGIPEGEMAKRIRTNLAALVS